MTKQRLWEQQAQKKKRFKESKEVKDPEVVIDTRPDEGTPEALELQQALMEAEQTPMTPPPVSVQQMLFTNERSEKLEELESAARVLVTFLPDDTQSRINEAHAQMGWPLWQMLLGYTMRAREREEIFFPMILSMWEFALPANAPRPCGSCGHLFTTRFGEGRYCCAPCAHGKLGTLGPDGKPRDHTDECTTRTTKATAA